VSDHSVRVTRPFDEDSYPRLHFSRQQLDVIALAREMNPKPIRTKLVAERFGCTFNQAYQVLRRLRDKGVFHSLLRWVTLPGGNHAAKVEPDGTRRLFSWLALYLQPMEKWGGEPDEIQACFRRKDQR
jgi:hypothetical protein